MRIQITEVLDAARQIVAFSCTAGQAAGQWMGQEPARTGEFDAEFEIPDEVGSWTSGASGSGSLSGGDSGEVAFEGVVAAIGEDDDPVVSIQVGTDILLVEMSEQRAQLRVGEAIAFSVPTVQLYPYEL